MFTYINKSSVFAASVPYRPLKRLVPCPHSRNKEREMLAGGRDATSVDRVVISQRVIEEKEGGGDNGKG